LETYKVYSYVRVESLETKLQAYPAHGKDSGDITKAEDSEDNIIRAAREGQVGTCLYDFRGSRAQDTLLEA
jgi:hypothetical protein